MQHIKPLSCAFDSQMRGTVAQFCHRAGVRMFLGHSRRAPTVDVFFHGSRALITSRKFIFAQPVQITSSSNVAADYSFAE